MLWIEPESGDEPQGLGFFAQYGWSPSDRNAVDRYHGLGMTYRGLVPQRDIDLVGVGLASAHFSAADTNREEAVEVFYKTQITDWFTIQPDMVYIANPMPSSWGCGQKLCFESMATCLKPNCIAFPLHSLFSRKETVRLSMRRAVAKPALRDGSDPETA
jgi:carbohydrate-selective porin OprB